MMDESTEELAALYVLGLLEPVEAAAFAKRMAASGELQSAVRDLEETAASLAYMAPRVSVPAGLKDKVMSQIGPESKVVRGNFAAYVLPWAAAACIALAAIWLASDRVRLQHENAQLRERVVLSQLRIATLTSSAKESPDSVAAIAWDEKNQRGVLDVRNLPLPAADKDYQLWVIDPQYQQPISAGVFRVIDGVAHSEFAPSQPIDTAQKFAISIERKGGAAEHEGPIVLVGE